MCVGPGYYIRSQWYHFSIPELRMKTWEKVFRAISFRVLKFFTKVRLKYRRPDPDLHPPKFGAGSKNLISGANEMRIKYRFGSETQCRGQHFISGP
jgi:hypothetical protein